MKTRELRTEARRRADQLDGRDGGVQTFFDQFARSLTSGDGKVIGGTWTVPAPAPFMSDKSVRVVTARPEVERFFGGAKEGNEMGAESSSDILRRDDTGDLKRPAVVMRGMTT